MAVYIWNTRSHLQRWESMHHDQQIFHIGKEWFYVRLETARCCEWQWWLQLSLQNRKKKKKEMHTHHVRNTYNTLGMHVIEVKGTSHLLFSWEIYHKISMTWQNVIAGGKPLFQNVVVHIAYAVNPLMTGSVIWLRHYTIFNLGEISGFLGIFRRLNHSCVLLKDFFFWKTFF